MLTVRTLKEDEVQLLKDVMLGMFAETPTAFGDTLASAEARTDEGWRHSAAEYATNPNMVAFLVAESEVASAFVSGSVLLRKVIAQFEGLTYDGGADEYSDTTILRHMWVAPELRGQGVAQALIQAVIEWARAKGQGRVVLGVTEGNAIAQRSYARAGFVLNGHTFPHPWHPAKVIIMEYVL